MAWTTQWRDFQFHGFVPALAQAQRRVVNIVGRSESSEPRRTPQRVSACNDDSLHCDC